MLPDFPKLKLDVWRHLRSYLESRMLQHLGMLSQSPRVRFFEGHESTMVRESGDEETVELFDVSATMAFRDEELPTLSLEDLLERLDAAAKDMAGQMAKNAYDTVSKAAERYGNAIDVKQRALGAEMILEGLSRMHIHFDRDGRPQIPSIVCHPDLEKAARLATEELDRNPALRKQMQDLLVLKKEEWRVREASRSLVG